MASTLIKNGLLVTMENRKIIRDGAVYVEDSFIVDCGNTDEVRRRHQASHVIDAKWKMILPGFINAHYHSDVSIARTIGADETISTNLAKLKWPRVLAMKPEDYKTSALLGYAENITMGAVLVGDNFYARRGVSTEGVARAAEKTGIRSILMKGFQDEPSTVPAEFIESPEELNRDYDALIQQWNGRAQGRIRVWISPVNLQYTSTEGIAKVTELALKRKTGIHTHASEDRPGVEAIRKRFGKTYIEVFKDLGTLTLGRNFQVAHGIFLTENEMRLLAKADSTVIHNPVSNLMRRAGIAPVMEMLQKGIRVALGTDSKQDIHTAMRLATGLQNITTPLGLKAWDALEMATIRGAEAFNMQDQIGSIKPGKKADIILVNMKNSHSMPIADPIAAQVYFTNSSDVDTVMIDGEMVMEDRKLLTVNEDRLVAESQRTLDRLIDRIGIQGLRG